MRTRQWLHSFLTLGARSKADRIPSREIERQEDTVLRALELLETQPKLLEQTTPELTTVKKTGTLG